MPDWGTGISSALSLYSTDEASDSASEANSLDEAALQLEVDRDRFNKEQIETMNEWTKEDRADFMDRRDRERGMMDPVQESIVNLAMEGPDYEGAMARSDADVSQSYGLTRAQERRRRQRYGVNPSAGSAMAEEGRMGHREALSRVQGRNRARMQEDDLDWARKIAAYGTGNYGMAQPGGNLSQLGVSGQSGLMGAMAQGHRANASGAYQFAGSMFADAMDRYGNNTQTTTSNTNAPASSGTPAQDDYTYWE